VPTGTFQQVLASVGRTEGVRIGFSFDVLHNTKSSYDGFVGKGNTSLLDWELTEHVNGNVDLVFPDGIQRTFVWNSGSSTFTSPAGCTCVLTKISTGVFERTFPTLSCNEGGIQKYRFSSGHLEWMRDRFENQITPTWSSGQVTSIADTRGQNASLSYYDTGRLETYTDAHSYVWTFKYNELGQLHKVEGPNTTSFPNGIDTEFRYVNGSSTAALNGNVSILYDGRGNAWLKNYYDSNDRVMEQYVGGGTSHFAFSYHTTNPEATVTDPVGNIRVWTWDSTKLTKASLVEQTNRNVRSGEGNYTTTWATDTGGYVTSVTYPRGNGVKYTLNSVKLPTEIRRKTDMSAADSDSNDLIDTYTYDSSKYYGVTAHVDPCQDDPTYTLNSYGQPTTVTFETLTHVTPNVTITNSYTYNSNGTVASFTDGEGKVTSYTYYTTGVRKGRLNTKVVDSGTGGLGLTTTYDWWDWGDLKTVTDPRSNTTTYTHHRYGNRTKVEAPSALGYVTQYTYDANLNVTAKAVKNIDWDGTWLSSPQWWATTYVYGGTNKVTTIDEQIGSSTSRSTTLEYDANDNLAKVIRDDRETRMVYDERDLLYQRTREGGTSYTDLTERRDYDGNRNVTLTRNARTKDTAHEYDLFDLRTKTINALGHYQTFTYTKAGNVVDIRNYEEAGTTDVLKAHHKNTYDKMGRLWKEEDALIGGSTTWYARTMVLDGRDLVVSRTDRRSKTWEFACDGAGRRISQEDPLGNLTEWEYDGNGNVTAAEETDIVPSSTAETFRTEFEYDQINRQKKQTVIDRTNSSNTKVTEWKSGVLGLRKTIDPKGNEILYSLDGLGRTTQSSQDMGSSAAVVTQWTFNVHDQVTRLRDDNSNDTDYGYDPFGRLILKTYESTKTVEYQHDANGNVVSIEDQNLTVVAHGYDDLDRLTGRDITKGTGVGGDDTEDFAYDALNRLTEASDNDSVVQFTYDSLSRTLTEVQGSNPLGTTGKTVTYTWDAEGNRTKTDYPSGFDANEARDDLGRISGITDGSAANVASLSHYGPSLRHKGITFGNGTTATYTYDGFRRPTAIDHKTSGGTEFAGFDYRWDANDNPLYEERSHASGAGDVYTYDKANRLTKMLRDCADPSAEIATPNSQTYGTKLEYDMDDVFNLTAYKTTPSGGSTTTTSYTTNSMNEYTAIGSQSPTYTGAGSLADDDTYSYIYDAHQHLIEVKQGSTTIATYAYDALGLGLGLGLGRRTKKVVGSATTRYVYAGQQSIEEYDGTSSSANLLRLFVFGQEIDHVLMMEAPDYGDFDGDSNTTEVLRFHYHSQLVGSVTQVTGPSEAVVETYLYDPYGKSTIKNGAGTTITSSAIKNPYHFTGRQVDDESGLYYYRARTYSADLRRFLQRDPSEYVDGPNALQYGLSSPASSKDPSGRCAVKTCSGRATVNEVFNIYLKQLLPPAYSAATDPKYATKIDVMKREALEEALAAAHNMCSGGGIAAVDCRCVIAAYGTSTVSYGPTSSAGGLRFDAEPRLSTGLGLRGLNGGPFAAGGVYSASIPIQVTGSVAGTCVPGSIAKPDPVF
jgi:RHS repeat-associated protein